MNRWIAMLGCTLLLTGCPQSDGPQTPAQAASRASSAPQATAIASRGVSAAAALAGSTGKAVPGDMTGDGRSDLLLDYVGDQLTRVWEMNGPTVVADRAPSTSVFCGGAFRRVATGDFNGDGLDDILMVDASARVLCEQVTVTSAATPKQLVGTYAQGWEPWGIADVNGDGKADIVMINRHERRVGYWVMDGATARDTSTNFAWPTGARRLELAGDFNGDGRADLLWSIPQYAYESYPTDFRLWTSTGTGFVEAPLSDSSRPPHWEPMGAGDVNGDGKSDLLMYNAFHGYFAYWMMDGARVVTKSAATARTTGYDPVAFGDYDGNGRVDILWARAADRTVQMWLGDGVGFTARAVGAGAPYETYRQGYRILGRDRRMPVRDDYLGDGRSDLLVSNDAEHGYTYWDMDGPRVLSTGGRTDYWAGPHLLGTGDFDADGHTDLLWQGSDPQTLTITYFSSNIGRDNTPVSVRLAAGWAVRGVGDVDGNGHADIVVQNNALQQVAYWYMDGASVARFSPAYPLGGPIVTMGDLDGDDRLDLVVSYSSGLTVVHADAPSVPSRTLPLPAAGWRITDAADVDGDGRHDLVLANTEGVAYWILEPDAAVWGNGGPQVKRYSPGFLNPAGYRQAALGDYDGDGKLDVAWSNGRAFLMWVGDGNGFFQLPASYAPNPGFDIFTR